MNSDVVSARSLQMRLRALLTLRIWADEEGRADIVRRFDERIAETEREIEDLEEEERA